MKLSTKLYKGTALFDVVPLMASQPGETPDDFATRHCQAVFSKMDGQNPPVTRLQEIGDSTNVDVELSEGQQPNDLCREYRDEIARQVGK